jgi:hypothetical protein
MTERETSGEFWSPSVIVGDTPDGLTVLRNRTGSVQLRIRREDLFDICVELHRRSHAYKAITEFSVPIERGTIYKVRVRRRTTRTTPEDDE